MSFSVRIKIDQIKKRIPLHCGMIFIVKNTRRKLMMPHSKQHDKQFKLDVVKYRKEHPELTLEQCAKNLGIGVITLSKWLKQFRDHEEDIPVRGSGNYASDEQKEIARLKRDLRDAQDALDVLKKAISILGQN